MKFIDDDNIRRILIIDDNESIHDDIKKCFSTLMNRDFGLDKFEEELFGNAKKNPSKTTFQWTSAYQGQEGFSKVLEAKNKGEPFMVAFVDIRMPPGWNGIETIGKIWQLDPDIQVVICTAYSDFSLSEIRDWLGSSSNLFIIKKPFDIVEIVQLISSLSEKWILVKKMKNQKEILEETVRQRTVELQNMLSKLENEINEKENSEKERKKLQVQLEHNEKLALIGQFAAGVAHELNEPLGNILGFAELAQKNERVSFQVKSDLDDIVKASLFAKSIIGELLTFAKKSIISRSYIDLNDLITENLITFEKRFKKSNIKLKVNLDKDLPKVFVDPMQLSQVIINLLKNAYEAILPMNKEGRITIKTFMQETKVVMSFEDNGVGIDDKIKNKIFNPFFTTKDVSKGTGLGLSVTHGIVSSHGGEIKVYSTLKNGTCFKIELPVSKEK